MRTVRRREAMAEVSLQAGCLGLWAEPALGSLAVAIGIGYLPNLLGMGRSMSEQMVESRWRRWAAEVPPIAFLASAVTFLFWHALTTPGTFFLRDHLFTFRPYRAVVARMLRDGVMPLWNPHVYFGQPLHAVLMQVLYPTTLLHYFLGFEDAFKAHIIFHYYLAAFGMYALGSALRMSRTAACGAGVAYALGSFMGSDGAYFNSVTTAGWAPWVIVALVACARRPTLARLALAPLPLAFALIGGEVQTLFLAVTVAFLVAVAEADGPVVRRIVRVVLPFGLVGVLGVALALVQVLPTVEMLGLSPRGTELGEFERNHFSLVGLTSLELLVPKILGSPVGDYYYMGSASWGGATGRQYPYFASIYIGLAPFCLWMCGAILGKGTSPRVLGVVAVLSLVLMYGDATPLFRALAEAVPGLKSFRYPSKYFTLTSFAGALLTGYGVDALSAVAWSAASVARRRVWGVALALVLAGIAVGGWALLVGKDAIPYLFARARETGALNEHTPFERAEPMFLEAHRSIGVTVSLHAALLLAAAWALSGRRTRLAAAVVVGVLAVDLARANLDLQRVASPGDVATAPGILEGLPADVKSYRITTRVNQSEHKLPEGLRLDLPVDASVLYYHQFLRQGLLPCTAIAHGFRYGSLFDFGSIYPRILGELQWEITARPDRDWVTYYQRTGIRFVVSLEKLEDPRLRLVRTVPSLSTMPYRLYEVSDPLPRALLVPSARRMPDGRKRMKAWISPEFDPRAEVLLEGTGAAEAGGGPIAQRVDVEEGKDPGRVLVRVDAERDAWLLLIDSWSPGWKATVDGAPVEIERADLMFRAVRVPAGKHEVLFRYDPWTFKAGLAVSLGTAGLCLVLLLVPLVLRRPMALPTAAIEGWADSYRWPLGLGIAVTWFHMALLSPATCLFKADHYYTYRPYLWVISETWRHGELPLWNPHLFFGQPLLATLMLVVYPTSLLYPVLPFETAYDLHFLIHAFVAAFSMYVLGRRLGWASWIAFISAATWALGGYMVSVEQYYNVVVAAAWAPAVIWAIDRVVERPTARGVALAAVVAALQLLGGEVMTIGFTYIVGLTLWTRHLPASGRPAWLGRAAAAGGACVSIAVLLVAFQVLPTAELIRRSPRASGLPEAERQGFSMSWATAAEMAFPRYLGDPANDAYYQGVKLWGTTQWGLPPYFLTRYVGVAMLLLAIFGGVATRGWRSKALVLLLLFGFVEMFGANLPPWARAMDWLPLVRSPIKFFALLSLAQSVLIGEALTCLTSQGWRDLGGPRRVLLVCGGLGCVVVILAGVVLGWAADSIVPREMDWLVARGALKLAYGDEALIANNVLMGGARQAGSQAGLTAIVLVLLLLSLFRARTRAWSIPLLALAVVADLAAANRGANPVARVDLLATRPQALDLLPAEARGERVNACVPSLDGLPDGLLMSPTSTRPDPHDILVVHRFLESILSPHTGFRYGLRYGVPLDPGRIYPRELERVAEIWRSKKSGPRTRFLQRSGQRYLFSLSEIHFPEFVERGQAECLANVPVRLYEVSGVLPRAYVVPGEVQEADLEKAVDLWLSKGFDASRLAIVEGPPMGGGGPGTASLESERSREVVVQADAPQGGTLVLLDSYDPGWVAEMDGRMVPVLRANALFRGVRLPPGRHVVRFRYEPGSFRVGASISLAALGLTLFLLVRRTR